LVDTQAVKKQIEDKQAIVNAIQKSGEISRKHMERIENVLKEINTLSEFRDSQIQQAQLLVRSLLRGIFVLTACARHTS
jgi:hypothetical protein